MYYDVGVKRTSFRAYLNINTSLVQTNTHVIKQQSNMIKCFDESTQIFETQNSKEKKKHEIMNVQTRHKHLKATQANSDH